MCGVLLCYRAIVKELFWLRGWAGLETVHLMRAGWFSCEIQGHGSHVGRNHGWQISAHGLHGYVGASARVAPLRRCHKENSCIPPPVVQPVHLHRHTRAARARKSANHGFGKHGFLILAINNNSY